MANQRTRSSPKSKPITSVPDPLRSAMFGPPPLLPGDNAAVYDAFCARICAAVNPIDMVEEILVNDVASLEWEVLRCRRWKLSLIKALGLAAFCHFRCSLQGQFSCWRPQLGCFPYPNELCCWCWHHHPYGCWCLRPEDDLLNEWVPVHRDRSAYERWCANAAADERCGSLA